MLELISKGHTYEQILTLHPDLTYLDIFSAAAEALELAQGPPTSYEERLARIHQQYSRAYAKWTDEEDARLEQLVRSGCSIDDIAAQLQRQPSAIRSRMRKRDVAADDAVPE